MRLNPFNAPKISPAKILVGGFALLILVGAVLLSLPAAAQEGRLSFLDALFTATSAVCVTGLVVVDTGAYFSRFGQIVIMGLIQIGGIGIMTAATIVFVLLGRKITLRERLVIQEALNQVTLQGLVRLVVTVVLLTFAVEAIGALMLSIRFIPIYGLSDGIYYSIFHAISAFCNAGFDLFGTSLEGFAGDPLVLGVIASLLIIGGLGFTVTFELLQRRRFTRMTLHTKMVLIISAALLLSGTFVIFGLEFSNPETLGDMSFTGKFLNAFFASATTRTAGFNTMPTGYLTQTTLFFMLALMFIGASPTSTGGGIKTTTFGAVMAMVISTVKGDEGAVLINRRIPYTVSAKALAVSIIAFALFFLITMALLLVEQAPFSGIVFEAMSAFGTVGLSTGITPELSVPGRIIIIFAMFAGRVGPLTLVFAFARRRRKLPYKYTSEKILIG